MRLSLSTNWCNRRLETGEAIVDAALALGFGELELGFHTTAEQVAGFRRRLDEIPVGSVHAFCPVPISAPQGYPELYQLASFDREAVKMAHLQVVRNIAFAADIGADTLVLHAGRVMCETLFASWRARKRERRGRRLLELFRAELESLVPELTRRQVTLALENLPYFEGFPNESELVSVLGWELDGRVKGWFDTGHAQVRKNNGWTSSPLVESVPGAYVGMHLNDVRDREDDHLAPSFGQVDFAALKDLAESVRHVVFEPNPGVTDAELRKGIDHIRSVFGGVKTMV